MHSLKMDLHIHSKWSDGKLSVREIVDLYGRHNYDLIAITDHIVDESNLLGKAANCLGLTLSSLRFQDYKKEIAFEADYAMKNYGMRLLTGYEVSKNHILNRRSAHFLVIGLDHLIDARAPVSESLGWAKSEGAVTIAAHPFLTGELEFQSFYLWSNREVLSPHIDAWEVSYRSRWISEVENSKLPLIASSDFHNFNHWRAWRSRLRTDCTAEDLSLTELSKGLQTGRVDFFLESELLPQIQVMNTLPASLLKTPCF